MRPRGLIRCATLALVGLSPLGFALAVPFIVPSVAVAQQDGTTRNAETQGLRSPVLILDHDMLFLQSQFGQRVLQEIEEAGRALIAENDRIEADLTAEERALTTQRESLPPAEFRQLADAFDEKVQKLRAAQQEKAGAVGQNREAEEARFRQLVTPIIVRLMQDAGALVVLDRSEAVVWVEPVNITEDVRRLADRLIGDGRQTPPQVPSQVPSQGFDLPTGGGVLDGAPSKDGTDPAPTSREEIEGPAPEQAPTTETPLELPDADAPRGETSDP